MSELVTITPIGLPGELTLPKATPNSMREKGPAIVLFAHGSGSSRSSPRNRFVARTLNEAGFATLLFDLLTEAEDAEPARRFDIPLLAQRLMIATEWVRSQDATRHLAVGYFGASTGAAAALVAAARLNGIFAVVSRGGRPDLAGAALPLVQAPTLLIVGGLDFDVLELNRQALAQLVSEGDLRVVEGATHLFEEPGALHQVAELAAGWFVAHAPTSGVALH